MTTEDLVRESVNLKTALDAFDWEAAGRIVREVVDGLWRTGGQIPPKIAAGMLGSVRRKRQFRLLERLAEGVLMSGVQAPVVRRQYAQALIDQGRFAAAEHVLRSILADQDAADEISEARGLLGRLYKQLYVNAGEAGPSQCAPFLHRAIAEYSSAYRTDPANNHWHGINVVALSARARKDDVEVAGDVAAFGTLADDLLLALDALQNRRIAEAAAQGDSPSPPPAFELASRVEALVARRRFNQAVKTASAYVGAPGTDAFELGSTERQLREVWKLDDEPDPDAAQVLAIIRAALLSRQDGGNVRLAPAGAQRGVAAAEAAATDLQLQALLGTTGTVNLAWYRQGLECCRAVVQVQTTLEEGLGTGWLIEGGALHAGWQGQLVMVTNKHVISPAVGGQRYQPAPGRSALLPSEAVLYHELSSTRVRLTGDDLLWSSEDLRLDATVMRVRPTLPDAAPLDVSDEPVRMASPPERVYVIGHPAGRGLELSLQDNVMLACDDRRIHYRAPTEGGSSGSPVFDRQWRVIAVHHGGGETVSRLDGSGKYRANEGIAIAAVRGGIAAGRRR